MNGKNRFLSYFTIVFITTLFCLTGLSGQGWAAQKKKHKSPPAKEKIPVSVTPATPDRSGSSPSPLPMTPSQLLPTGFHPGGSNGMVPPPPISNPPPSRDLPPGFNPPGVLRNGTAPAGLPPAQAGESKTGTLQEDFASREAISEREGGVSEQSMPGPVRKGRSKRPVSSEE